MTAPAAQQPVSDEAPVSTQVVGNAFVQQYYHILQQSPGLVHRFYHDNSKLGRPEDDGSVSTTTTMEAINVKILSLKYDESKAVIKSVDAQESLNNGVNVLVTGYLIGKDSILRNFTQSFFLAPQDTGYFVLNDMFRYMENVNHHEVKQGSVEDVVSPVTPEQEVTAPVPEIHISEQSAILVEEANGEEVYNPSENGEVSVVEEEVPVAEIVDELQDTSLTVVDSNIKIEEVPKKSYASIVMDLKGSDVHFSSPVPVPRKSQPRSQEQQVNTVPLIASVTEAAVCIPDAVEIGNNQEGEADGYSIYIKGLPMNATRVLLEEEFKKYGPIKSDGIQVRSNRGFCFGFVEFEVPDAVQKAIEASPVTIGGCHAIVEEKRSTNSRANRVRFAIGRGSGFRNDGMRGRGNYGGGRGYNSRGDFSGSRTEYGSRANNRGGSSNRGGDGYQRADNNGGRVNRGMAVNGTAKNFAPRVSAIA